MYGVTCSRASVLGAFEVYCIRDARVPRRSEQTLTCDVAVHFTHVRDPSTLLLIGGSRAEDRALR
jgi:hypothetical protein